ncbi:receptor-type tyrosine-protein phosphatase eta-like isoform X1 [Mytilus galloprovincialis]|uniref:receptor-type tyrosine-protein phosphatase eta-like isoform X1 n=1 Tax=Mytilus galloprovincialis TaxID=29158 RepID=UPI003F7B67B6
MLKYFVGLYFICLFYIPDISAITIYTSQKNSHVTLACDVKLSEKQLDQPYTIKWKSSGGSYPTVIEKLSNKDAVIDKSFTDRVELVNGTSLKINGLQPGDARDYYCSVKLYNSSRKDGQWIRLKVNDDPIPTTTRPTNKPVSIISSTTTATTSTRVATSLSVTPYTVRDGDGDDGGDDTESDGSGKGKIYTDVSVDKSKGTSSVDAVTDPKTTAMVDTENQSLKESTEISTVKSRYDKTQTISDKTSVDEKEQSVNSPGLEQDLPTNDITSETLTSELKTNLHTATMMSHSNTQSLTETAITTANQSEQEDKLTTETETEKTTISRNGSSSPSVDKTRTSKSTETTRESITITEAAVKTTKQSEQEDKTSTETKTDKTTILRNGSSSSSVDMTRTRLSTETTPEPVTTTEAAIKTSKQSEQEDETSTETKTDKTTILRNGSSSSSVDMTRTRIPTKTTPEPVTITEAAVKTSKQSEQEDKTSTETKTDKTTILRNGSSSSSVDMTRTIISTKTTPEPVTITEAGDKSESHSIGISELTTEPSVKVAMTTLSAKNSYETSTTSQQLQTTTGSGLFFNVTITERKLNVIQLQVRISSTKGEKFSLLKWVYKTEENSTRTEEKKVRGSHYIDKSIKVKGLEIGFCYDFQIDVQTQKGRWIGPIVQKACTKPRAPGSGTRIGNTTITSIPLLIEHPADEHFDRFRIDYENNINSRKLSMTVARAVGVNQTKTEITGLVPQSCYTIDVYAVSFSEISQNSRSFTNVCTQTPLDPNSYTVIYGDSSFTIFWVKFSDKYHVNVSCNYLSQVLSRNKPSLSVNGTIPGDCCVLNVKNWNYTVSRHYFVHVNETLPEYPVVISNITTRTHLNLTWREPMRSNGWIHGYTVNLFDSEDTTIENYTVSCIQPEPKCSRNDSYWNHQEHQCSSFSLANNRNGNIYYNNSQFYLSIRGLKPGMIYQYSVTAMNKAGSNTTDRITVITLEDKPESPASLNVTVLNVTTMSIMWSPPNVTNGIITGYNVSYCSNGISGCKYTVEGMTSVILRNLDCWKEYLVCVSAITSAGAGSQKCGVKNTSVYEPQSKISKTTASNTTIKLEFEVPCDSVDAPISYQISYIALDHSCTGDQTNDTQWWECFPLRRCEITGLFPYWDYFIKVQETVEDNVGVWSNELKITTLHSVPEEVRNVRAENTRSDSLTVCWEKPCFLNSDAVFYNVTLDEDTPSIMISRSGAIPGTECTNISNLLPYTNYTISVTASNQYGKADPVIIVKQTDIAVPNQPRFSGIEEHATMLTVEWKPPYPYTGPTNYTVTVRDLENSETKDCKTSVYNQTRCSVYGLEEYWQYEVTITAHTERGTKQYKHPHIIQTKQSAPGPVTHLRVNHEKDPEKPRLVFITFSPPVYRERNGVIKAYYVKCRDTKTYRDIQVVKLNNNLTELKMIVPDQVLLNISVFAETVANGTEVYQTVIVPAGAKDLPIRGALAGVFLAIILFIIIAIVVILYRKQMICFKPQPKVIEKVNLTGIKQNKKVSVDHEDTRKSRPVKIDKFYQHVELLARDSDHFFSKEYKELKAMAPMHPTEAAVQQEARTKNRYSNILPFDHSRVKLLPLDDEDGSDYINANYIPGFNSKREYIATQGPLPATKDDFWRMIWEQNVSVIVMLTQCVERGKRKCECYWPECVKEPVYYGDLSIEIENESHLPEYVLRTITVTLGNIQKRIMHFLYLAWPDMGVPSSTDNMISLVKTVRSHINPTMKGPMTVHCSAGVGRTGTFINVDVLLHQLDNDYNQIDIFGEVLKLRNHRCNMVQTEDQYVFIHHCISDYILAMSEDTDEEDAVDGGDEPMYQNVPSKK